MRYLPIIALLISINACDNADAKKDVESSSELVSNEPSIEQWINALQRFQQALINNDKEELLALFPLQIDEDHFYTIVHADSLSEAFAAKNQGKLDRAFMEKHFKTLYQTSGIAELNAVIHRVDLNKLSDRGLLEGKDHRRGEPCYHHYSIKLSGDEAIITFGDNTDDDYLRTHPDEDMACGEYSYMILLKLVNNKLSFKRIDLAG